MAVKLAVLHEAPETEENSGSEKHEQEPELTTSQKIAVEKVAFHLYCKGGMDWARAAAHNMPTEEERRACHEFLNRIRKIRESAALRCEQEELETKPKPKPKPKTVSWWKRFENTFKGGRGK